MTGHRGQYTGIDGFQDACQREHKKTMSSIDGRVDLLEMAEAKINAGHDKSKEELKTFYESYTDPQLEDKLTRHIKLQAEGQVQRTGKVDVAATIAELEQELRRRKTSQNWLAQAKANAHEARREKSPIDNRETAHGGNRHRLQGRQNSLNKGKPNGSVGCKQVAAALQGGGKGLAGQKTLWNVQSIARKNSLPLYSSSVTPMQECMGCNMSVPHSSRTEGEGPFFCHECRAKDDQVARSIKGKGKAADQSVVEKDPYADLEDYSDLGTAATAADEAGPSSLALKENLQPLPGRISANTRGQQPRPGLVDTRTIAEPSLKGQSASGTLGGRLRNAAPKGGIGGTEPASFYGPASTQQPHAEDFPGSQRRQSSRVQKRKAEQSLEPIMLDDSDEEGAGQAQPGPRRTTRSNAYKGPADTLKGLKALYPEHGGPGSVEVVPTDLVRLQPGEFLNDTIIDFYMRWIWQHLPEATQKRCYFFNSFFYKKLSEKQPGLGPLTPSGRCEAARAAHERVRKWTKGVDIFEKDFLFMPIHDHLHWSLVIICHAGVPAEEDSCTPWILHLDSMTSGHHTPKIKKELLAYLTQEWDYKVLQGGESRPALWAIGHREAPQRHLDIGHKRLTLPMQDNHCDCGLFLLTYTDYFTHSLPAAIRTKRRDRLDPPELEGLSTYPLFMQKQWFQPENAGALRAHIKTVILELFLAQGPVDQKDTLDDALTVARIDVEEYRDDSQVLKYKSPADYESTGLEKRRSLEQDRAEKLAKAEQRRQSGKGRRDFSNIVTPRIPDSEDDGNGRPALRLGRAPRLGPALTGSSASDDFEVCLDEDATPSGTPVRQLRSPAERAPTAKAAAMVADRLQKSPEGAGLKRKTALESRRAAHVLDDADDISADVIGGSPEPGQIASHEEPHLGSGYSRFRVKRLWSEGPSPKGVKVADSTDSWASTPLGPAESDWHSFKTEADARAWMDMMKAQAAMEAEVSTSAPMHHERCQDRADVVPGTPDAAAHNGAHAHPAPLELSSAPAHGAGVTGMAARAEPAASAGGSRPPGLVDDGPEDLTADDGPEPQAEQITPPDLAEGAIQKVTASFGYSQPRPPVIDPCPEYLNLAAASVESLAQASAKEAQLKHETPASGTGAHQHTGALPPQQLGCHASTASQTAQQHYLGVQKLLGFLQPLQERAVAFTTPKVFQRQGKKTGKRQRSSADRPDIETSSEEAEGGRSAAEGAEDSRIDLTSDCEAPAAQAASGRVSVPSPSSRPAAPEAEANGHSCLPAQWGCSPNKSQEAKADCSDGQAWQGINESKQEQTQSKMQYGGSFPVSDSSQEPFSELCNDSDYVPEETQPRHKRKQHKPNHVRRPAKAALGKVQGNPGHMTPQPEQDGVASAAPPEDAPWRQRKRSASSSPLPPPQPPSSSLQQIRSDSRVADRSQWGGSGAVHLWQAPPNPIPVSQWRHKA